MWTLAYELTLGTLNLNLCVFKSRFLELKGEPHLALVLPILRFLGNNWEKWA